MAPLRVGSKGPQVKQLEQFLKKEGVFKGQADGTFDTKTKHAVQKYERRHGWKADGIAGSRFEKAVAQQTQTAQAPQSAQPVQNGKPGNGTFNVTSMNVKSNPLMSQAKVVHDVKRAASKSDIIGWQEIAPTRYRKAIKNLKGFDTFMPKGLETPISWKKSEFDLLGSGVRKMHGGMKGVSPHRSVAWVKLRNKDTGEVMIHMNTHLVSGAWNGKKQATDPWRQRMWKKHIAGMKAMISRFERQGYPVTITGDFNRNKYKVLGNEVAYASGTKKGTHGKSTLDYVMNTRNPELQVLGSSVDPHYASDHNGVTVRYDLD